MKIKLPEHQLKKKCLACLVFFIIFAGCSGLYNAILKVNIREMKNRYQYMGVNEANFITNCIDKVVVRTYTLREMIVENNGNISFFDSISPLVYQSVKNDTGVDLRNVGVAPAGRIKKVYPLATNEGLLNFDYMDTSKPGNAEAVEALYREKTIVTNPFNLVQGGVGMAARTPVFINKNGTNSFWGLVTATMNFDKMLTAFNLESLKKLNTAYCLWYMDEDGNKVELSQSGENFDECISIKFHVYNLEWNLDLMPEEGWYSDSMKKLAYMTIFVVSILMTALTLLVLRIKSDGTRMKKLAEQDSLTHTYSRHYLNSELLDVRSGDWKKPELKYSAVMIDVDKFKEINDKFGHNVGDRALIAVSNVIFEEMNKIKQNIVVRYGGDEFTLYLSDVSRTTLEMLMKNIVINVNSIEFSDIPELTLSVSVGGAFYSDSADTSYSAMMKRADLNLYEVKEAGRNSYCLK